MNLLTVMTPTGTVKCGLKFFRRSLNSNCNQCFVAFEYHGLTGLLSANMIVSPLKVADRWKTRESNAYLRDPSMHIILKLGP